MGTKKIKRGHRNKGQTVPRKSQQPTTRQGRRVIKERYLLQKELGKGGMGKTFLAQDTQFGDQCVVKIVTGDSQLIQREARRLCYLKHEGIPAYRDFILESSQNREDEAFLVQEYIRGKTLKQYAKDQGGRIPLQRALSVMRQALEVLEYLHNRKEQDTQEKAPVLHLDIKPENMILRESDHHLFLIDFGLSAQAHISLFIQQGLTPSIQGYSPGYSPYEQTQGRVVPASDIYALGMTMLVLLTGKDVREVRMLLDQNTLFQDPKVNIPTNVTRLLQRMVALRVEDRIQSAEEALRQMHSLRLTPSWTRRSLLWGLPLLLILVGLFFWLR